MFSIVAVPVVDPHQQRARVFFSLYPDHLLSFDFFFFDNSRPESCEVILQCGFELHFLDD